MTRPLQGRDRWFDSARTHENRFERTREACSNPSASRSRERQRPRFDSARTHVLVAAAGRAVLDTLLLPTGVLIGAAYLAIRALATAYGIVLWRCDGANRPAATLFAFVFPSMFVLGPLTLVGFPAAWIESPIHLAFVALGYDLLSSDAIPTAGGDGVAG